MLTSDQLDTLSQPIVDLYNEYIDSVIQDIARRLANLPASATAAWQLQRLTESGAVYQDAIDELSRLTGKSDKVLKATFEKAGVQALRFDDSIYKAAGLNPLPLNLSPAMISVLKAGLQKTKGLIENLTRTTAVSGQQAFIYASDIAYLQVSSGAMSYEQAIRQAIKQVASDGLTVVQFAGKTDQLDVAMRRAVLTGVSQTTGVLQIARADEMGVDLVQTSAHIGARPSHQEWQGRIFSRSGTDRHYPGFVSSTGYGTGAGLGGWNCRHSFYPFFKGISKNAYDKATTNDYAKRTVTYNGNSMSVYDATQLQRAYERRIRYWKRQRDALSAAGMDNTMESAKVTQWQAKIRDLLNQVNLNRQYWREQTA